MGYSTNRKPPVPVSFSLPLWPPPLSLSPSPPLPTVSGTKGSDKLHIIHSVQTVIGQAVEGHSFESLKETWLGAVT